MGVSHIDTAIYGIPRQASGMFEHTLAKAADRHASAIQTKYRP